MTSAAAGEPRALRSEYLVDAPVDEVFGWHERQGAVERLTPPWEPVRVAQQAPSLRVGSRTTFRTSVPGPVALRWVAEHTHYDPPREFRDVQVSGPFAEWEHRHVFESADGGATRLIDEVTCRLPLYRWGADAAWPLVRSRLQRMFDYRHRQLADDLAMHRRAGGRGAGTLHVAVAGSSGLVGSQLVALLRSGGHRVTRLVRREPAGVDEVRWDPASGRIDAGGLRGVDAVVNLAGASLVTRWTERAKRRIRESRVHGTRLLAETLAGMEDGPRVLVCASGINFYGTDRGDEALTERAGPGEGFLAELVRDWEAAADPAREAGLRVVHVRTGIGQSPRGGPLQLQLPLFHAGLGGRLGSGAHWMSWIGIDDLVGIYHHALTTPELRGPLNAVAPQPVTNADYSRTLARVLGRPAVLPVPKFGPALLLGEQAAEETAFVNLRVLPTHAQDSGYVFRHPSVEGALRHVLGR